MLQNHNRSFLIQPLFLCTPAGCDMLTTTKMHNTLHLKTNRTPRAHQQGLNCLHSFPFLAKTGGKQSCRSGQFFLQIERKQANVGQEPVQGQSEYWYSLMDREDCQFTLLVHRSLNKLTNPSSMLSLFIYFPLLASFPCPVTLWASSMPLWMSQESQWPGEDWSQREWEVVCLIYFTLPCFAHSQDGKGLNL